MQNRDHYGAILTARSLAILIAANPDGGALTDNSDDRRERLRMPSDPSPQELFVKARFITKCMKNQRLSRPYDSMVHLIG
jgi:hypothetical protein